MEIKITDFLKIITPSDRVRIIDGEKDIFTGWAAMLNFKEGQKIMDEHGNRTIKQFRAVPEIRHKEWQKRGLMSPIEPDKTPEYSFSDLQMSLYYTIYI